MLFFSITPIEYPFKDAEPFNFLQPNLPVRDNICSNMISVNALKLEEILIYIDKWCFYNLAFYHLSIYTSFGWCFSFCYLRYCNLYIYFFYNTSIVSFWKGLIWIFIISFFYKHVTIYNFLADLLLSHIYYKYLIDNMFCRFDSRQYVNIVTNIIFVERKESWQ